MEPIKDESDFSFPVDRKAGVAILTFPGEQYAQIGDPAMRATFLVQAQQELDALVEQDEKPRIVVDFHDVKFVNSGVLGMMVEAHRQASEKGGAVLIAGLQQPASEAFAATKLDKILSIYATVDDALRSID